MCTQLCTATRELYGRGSREPLVMADIMVSADVSCLQPTDLLTSVQAPPMLARMTEMEPQQFDGTYARSFVYPLLTPRLGHDLSVALSCGGLSHA